MEKRCFLLLFVIALLCLLAGCACKHDWSDATCEAPRTCKLCGETRARALGHAWKDATCSVPKICKRCNKEDSKTLPHTWEFVGCGQPQRCSVCDAAGEASPHSWKAADCGYPKHCTVCSIQEGSTVGEHNWQEATTSRPKHCSVCQKEEGNAIKGPDTRFDTEDCRAFFGTWLFEQILEDGTIYQWVMVFDNSGKIVNMETGYSQQSFFYYFQYDTLYLHRRANDQPFIEFKTEFSGDQMLLTNGENVIPFRRYSDLREPITGDGLFDADATRELRSTEWWNGVTEQNGQQIRFRFSFGEDGIMTVRVDQRMTATKTSEYYYYVKDGVLYYGSSWYGSHYEVQIRISDGKLSWTDQKMSLVCNPYKPDLDFVEKAEYNKIIDKDIFALWVGDVTVDASQELGYTIPGVDMQYNMHLSLKFQNNTRALITVKVEEESFMRVLRASTLESLYRSYEAQGMTRDQVDAQILQTQGMDTESYVDLLMESYPFNETVSNGMYVFCTKDEKLYIGYSWDSEMSISAYRIEGDELILTDEESGEEIVLTRK